MNHQISTGKGGRAFLEVFQGRHHGGGDPLGGGRDFVELAPQALQNQSKPPGLD
jgi:hypothetical protein